MKGCLKIAVVFLLLFILTLTSIVACAIFLGDTYARNAFSRGFQYVLRTDSHVEKAHIDFRQGTVTLQGVTINSPATFKADEALHIEQLTLAFDVRRLLTNTPVVKRAAFKGVHVNLRYEVGEGTNLGALMEAGKRAHTGDPAAPIVARHTVRILSFECDGADVNVSTNVLPVSPIKVSVEPFTLIDAKDKPIAPGVAIATFLRKIVRESITAKGLLSPVLPKIKAELAE